MSQKKTEATAGNEDATALMETALKEAILKVVNLKAADLMAVALKIADLKATASRETDLKEGDLMATALITMLDNSKDDVSAQLKIFISSLTNGTLQKIIPVLPVELALEVVTKLSEIVSLIATELKTEESLEDSVKQIGESIAAAVIRYAEFIPNYPEIISAIKNAITTDNEIKKIVSETLKQLARELDELAIKCVMCIEEGDGLSELIKGIPDRLIEIIVKETIIIKIFATCLKAIITTITTIEFDSETSETVEDAIVAMMPKEIMAIFKEAWRWGIMHGSNMLRQCVEKECEGWIGAETEIEIPETETIISEISEKLPVKIGENDKEGENQYIIFGSYEGEVPFAIGWLGKLNASQVQVVCLDIFRHFNPNIDLLASMSTLALTPIILSESVLLDRLRRKKLSKPTDEMREHLKAFPRAYSFFIDYADITRWLHDEVNFFQGIPHLPIGILEKLHSFLKRQKLSDVQRKMLQIYTRIADEVRTPYDFENQKQAMLDIDNPDSDRSEEDGNKCEQPAKKTRRTSNQDLTDPTAEQIKNKVNAWIAKNRSALSEDEQRVCEWLLESQNKYKGKGWATIASNTEYLEYRKELEAKRKKREAEHQKQGKKISISRAFADHIEGKCTTLLKKIMKSSDGQ